MERVCVCERERGSGTVVLPLLVFLRRGARGLIQQHPICFIT